MEIFCPRCEYVPKRADVWSCEAACGCEWHTFDTHGECPNCGKIWEETQCLSCQLWSPHKEWYHETVDGEIRNEMMVQA